MLRFISIFFIYSLVSPSTSLAKSPSQTPYSHARAEIARRLRTAPEWISATFQRYESADMMTAGGFLPFVMKKWRVQGDSLIERSKNSLIGGINPDRHWVSREANLNAPIPVETWTDDSSSQATFQNLGAREFAIVDQFRTVIVFPAPTPRFAWPILPKFKHMTAPAALDMGPNLKMLPPQAPITVLRHDLGSTRPVYVAKEFPARFVPALKSVLRKWNTALRANFYNFAGTMPAGKETCVARGWLCVLWQGSAEIPWAGVGGISVISYDPETGLITGGLIGFINRHASGALAPAPADIVARLASSDAVDAAASIFLKRDPAMNIAHPHPEQAVEAILLHEVGHDNGLNHYFMGSMHPTHEQMSDTVMDYPPYPLLDTVLHLGPRDLAKVNNIYFSGREVTETPCSDMEVMSSAYCLPGDAGAAQSWLMKLADYGDQGLNTLYQPLGGISLMFGRPEPLYKHFARFIMPNFPEPKFPENFPPEARAKLIKQFEEGVARAEKALSAQRGGLTRATSDEVTKFLCEPKHLSQVSEAVKSGSFLLNCH